MRPFDTADCPGVPSPLAPKKSRRDFVFAIPADQLINPNVVFVFELLERALGTGKVTKVGWAFLRLDQLYANGLDLANSSYGGRRNVLRRRGTETRRQIVYVRMGSCVLYTLVTHREGRKTPGVE